MDRATANNRARDALKALTHAEREAHMAAESIADGARCDPRVAERIAAEVVSAALAVSTALLDAARLSRLIGVR